MFGAYFLIVHILWVVKKMKVCPGGSNVYFAAHTATKHVKRASLLDLITQATDI